ncbi:MAG: hypothetical protein U9N45_08410, partial [Gemmatimonadota bacterium]|nr:hypothetical protein [Gemmatimonadota bacterium]
MKKSLLFILLSFFLLTVPAGLNAQNIKVLRKGGIDATELKSLVADITRDCKTDQEKMIALWAFITRKPFYHWCESREGPRATTEYGIVYDPVKAFNVYGTVICYQVADLLANMATEAGIPARTRGFPYRHKVMEAWHDGAWHLYDAQYDCQAYYLKPDGRTVASLNEVHADPVGYILEQKNPTEPFFQFEKFNGLIWPWETREYVVENWYKAFTYEELGCYYPFDCQGHTMIISLRRGEKLVRRWDNESKWYCTSELYDFWMRDLTQRWVALGPHDPRNPLNTYTNGRLIYKPDWKAAEVNFLDGLYDGSNYRLDNGRVYPAAAGKASVCFQVSSPYLLVGHPNRLSLDGDSEGGAIFNATIFRADQGAKVSLSVSTDNGISWKNVWH